MSDDLTFERQSGVATITINRPAGYNAMKAAMWSQMLPPQELATHWMRQADITNALFVTLERIPQPVIASVRGIAAGGGLGLVAKRAKQYCLLGDEMDAQTALDVGLCVAQPDFARRVRAFMERKR